MARVMVIEDEDNIALALDYLLTRDGHDHSRMASGAGAVQAIRQHQPDLVLLDVMLPTVSGIDVCRELRRRTDVPIIMVTAKAAEIDTVVGLEVGADDYLAKPFNPRELVARIQAVMRRQPQTLPGAPTAESEVIVFGSVRVNLGTRALERSGEEIQLTTGEFSLLKVLLQHPRQPLSRDKLMELARGREYGVFDRAIDVQISRLRKLVEDDPAKPRFIQTVWGFGYVFVPDDSKTAAEDSKAANAAEDPDAAGADGAGADSGE